MWKEIGKTVREAMGCWGTTMRMSVLVSVSAFAGVALIWAMTL